MIITTAFNGIGAEKKTNRSTPCPKKYGSSLFFACTTIRTVETLRRSQTRARKSELELNLKATRGLLFIFLFSIRLLREETHPKIFFLSKFCSISWFNINWLSNSLVRPFFKEVINLYIDRNLGIAIYMVHTYCRNFFIQFSTLK